MTGKSMATRMNRFVDRAYGHYWTIALIFGAWSRPGRQDQLTALKFGIQISGEFN